MTEHPSFNDKVDDLAGYALTELVKGKTSWRSIIYNVCLAMAQWSDNDRAVQASESKVANRK